MRMPFLAFLVAAPAAAVPLSVDLLSPGDTGFDGIPSNFRCVDVHVDLRETNDVFVAAGLRALTVDLGAAGPAGDAAIVYFDVDPDTPGVQPGLLNPGTAHRFTTSLSRPRDRDAAGRFEDAGAAIAGRYEPTGPLPVALPAQLNVAWFRSPPASWNTPADEGYVARIALDISGITAGDVDLNDYAIWNAGPLSAAPPGAMFVLLSDRPPNGLTGTIVATMGTQWGHWLDWGVWYVPEPASLVSLVLFGIALRRGR